MVADPVLPHHLTAVQDSLAMSREAAFTSFVAGD